MYKIKIGCFLLWLFFGVIGAHDFYVGRTWAGIVKVILFILTLLIPFIGLILFLIPILIWNLIDLFVVVLAKDLCKWQKQKIIVVEKH